MSIPQHIYTVLEQYTMFKELNKTLKLTLKKKIEVGPNWVWERELKVEKHKIAKRIREVQ